MKTLLTLTAPLGSEIMTTVRLTTGGVCSLAGLDLDRSEDCKVCVTESLLLLTHAGYKGVRITFCEDDGLFAEIRGEDLGEGVEAPEDEISAALLEALAEGVCTEKSGGKVSLISFRFQR